MENIINYNSTQHIRKTTIRVPVGSNKRWWQFWKKDKSPVAHKTDLDYYFK